MSIAEFFDTGAEDFAAWSPLLWEPIGDATVRAAGIRTGQSVADLCCGAGASAIPAAAATGPDGMVVGVDLAETLLAQGRRRARDLNLEWLRFVPAEIGEWSADHGTRYDVVLCVHGVYFLPDMDAAAKDMIGLLRPGGRIAVTTWARQAIQPFGRLLDQTITEETRRTPPPKNAADRIDTEQRLATWLAGLGLRDIAVYRIALDVPLDHRRAWQFVCGTGFRAMLAGLDEAARARVRHNFLSALDRNAVSSLDATSLIGVAHAPGPPSHRAESDAMTCTEPTGPQAAVGEER
jgi:2-polyprenyl-3-methyl-5-hydroxy-6-metoxy-1,4-benzoquinol methylase